MIPKKIIEAIERKAKAESDRWLLAEIKRRIDEDYYVKDGYVYFLTDQDNAYKVEYDSFVQQQYDAFIHLYGEEDVITWRLND